MEIRASKKYRDKMDGIESELKAPRKIIGWLIGFTAFNSIMLLWIIWRLST